MPNTETLNKFSLLVLSDLVQRLLCTRKFLFLHDASRRCAEVFRSILVGLDSRLVSNLGWNFGKCNGDLSDRC